MSTSKNDKLTPEPSKIQLEARLMAVQVELVEVETNFNHASKHCAYLQVTYPGLRIAAFESNIRYLKEQMDHLYELKEHLEGLIRKHVEWEGESEKEMWG